MKMDRAEWTGTGAALLFHVVLISAMSLSLAHMAKVPEPPSMEVEFVDNVGLTAATPTPANTPPPMEQSPNIDEPTPVVEPEPAPAPTPLPAKPAERPTPRPVTKPTPPTARPAPTRPVPARPAPRAPRLGDDFLKGVPDGTPSRTNNPPAAATVSASAMAGIVQAIRRQVQPCADRQVNPGPGASRIKVRMRLQLQPNGRLRRPPLILGTSGVDDQNAQYEERVVDLAVAAFVGCSPIRGLPPELYETTSGQGWSDFVMNYNLP